MKFAELKKSLASGQYSPIYLLTGDDEFLKTRAVDMLCAGIPYPEFNVINVDCPSSGELADILCAFPVMSDRRAVKVNTLNEAKELSKYLEHPDPSCTLIVRSIANAGARSKKRDDGLSLLAEKAECVDCSPMEERYIFSWLASEARKYDVSVEEEAARLLCTYCRNYMSAVSAEFAKLASYRWGGRITAEDVRSLVSPSEEYAVWQLSNAVAAGNASEAYRILRSFDDGAIAPEVLFSLLYKHFRKLFYSLITKDADLLAREFDIKEKAMFAVKREATRFGANRLKKILLTLGSLDEELKNGSIDREAAPQVLVSAVINTI